MDINIPATLAACRAKWIERKALVDKMPKLYQHPSTWREGESGHEETRSDVFLLAKAGEVVAEFYGDDADARARNFIGTSNGASDVLDVAKELLDKIGCSGDVEGYYDENMTIEEAGKHYDETKCWNGLEYLSFVARLLGVEPVQ